MKKMIALPALLLLVFLTGIYIAGCKKQSLRMSTTEDVNIVGYLLKHADSFSLFKQILDRTDNSPFLNAYGAYTCFAPTNSGVTQWLTAIGAKDVNTADLNTLKEMVKFHLMSDTINTTQFKDGKLPIPTMQGQFLITGVNFEGGISSYNVNRQAAVTQSNIKVGNGLIHVLDRVLVPASKTIAQQLEANPAKYSIFVEAMKATGFYDQLNTVDADTTKRWLTVIAESNQALADSGYTSYAALKTKYNNTGNPKDPKDSLHMYMAYHIMSGIKFLGDIITSSAHSTFEPQEVITIQLKDQQVLVNEDIFNGVLEKGAVLTRTLSDNAATNGVWHDASSHIMVKYRKPTALFWDVSTFPEIMKQPGYYMKATQNFIKQSEADKPIKDIDWHFNSASTTMTYTYEGPVSSITRYAVNCDVNMLPMGGPARATWAEYLTPVVIKGRYKVWVCYRYRRASASSVCQCNIRINGDLMQRPMAFTDARPTVGTAAELEAVGWKIYTENTTDGNFGARLVGTVDIKTTQRQVLRFEPIAGTHPNNYLDMVQFIPVDEPQTVPRFKPDGTKIY